jgi:nucleoside triphosphate diphosphatase
VSALDGVDGGLPALVRAEAISRLAAATGFDWDDAAGARAKVLEELAEVDAAATQDERVDELGDLLFATVNLARKLGVDPEAALHQASGKFERRFRAMEALRADFASLSLAEQEELWRQVKAGGSAASI